MGVALLRLLGLMLMLTALAVSVSRAPERPVTWLVARWALPPSDLIDLDGQLVHLRDEGPRDDAQPLLLLHGLGGSLHDWEAWALALRGTHRVIRVDLPGSGLTGASEDDDYRAASDARFVAAVLDRLQVERVRLVAQGRGGEVALNLALQAPQRVSRLLLVDSAPLAASALPPLLQALRLPLLPDWFVSGLLPRALVERALQSLWGQPARLSEEQVDRRWELLLREGNRVALRRQLRQAATPAEFQALALRLRLPVLLLWGGRDPLTPPEQAHALQGWVLGSRLALLDGLGHLPQEEDPVASLAAARGFLEAR